MPKDNGLRKKIEVLAPGKAAKEQAREILEKGPALRRKAEKGELGKEKQQEAALPSIEQLDESTHGIATRASIRKHREERKKKIEKVLAEDLDEIYLSMAPDKQMEFKRVGEETANKINDLLDKTKVKVKKIIGLIKKWLSIIPGVNKFFLEQEAKIKADEIINIKENKL